jgi:hypothetical protein
MPAYVVRIHPKTVDNTPLGHLVDYSDAPDWCFEVKAIAAQWQETLAGLNVKVGAHVCQFEAEEFKPGLFAVVCMSHPTKPCGRSASHAQ